MPKHKFYKYRESLSCLSCLKGNLNKKAHGKQVSRIEFHKTEIFGVEKEGFLR